MSCKPLSKSIGTSSSSFAIASYLDRIAARVLLFTGSLGNRPPGGCAKTKATSRPNKFARRLIAAKSSSAHAKSKWLLARLRRIPGGVSALCTLALLNTGVPAVSDTRKKMQRALSTMCGQNSAEEDLCRPRCKPWSSAWRSAERFAAHQTNATWLEDSQRKPTPIGPAPGLRAATGTVRSIEHAIRHARAARSERIGVPIRQQLDERLAILGQKSKAPTVPGNYYDDRITAPGTGKHDCAGVTSVTLPSAAGERHRCGVNGND